MSANSLLEKDCLEMKNKVKVGIVDYHVGNTSSVTNALENLEHSSIISNNTLKLKTCTHLILPGVGAFEKAYKQLNKTNLIPFLEEAVFKRNVPILGICLGMQLMLESSTENGVHTGLGWINGTVKLLNRDKRLKVPHVGWNDITILNKSLFENVKDKANCYFDHSYYCDIDKTLISSYITYGSKITSSFQKNNIYGVQFHPEKSQVTGLRIFKSFLKQ
jgi:imidazole glycerol-phosphate synthase subunit HisH